VDAMVSTHYPGLTKVDRGANVFGRAQEACVSAESKSFK
jgi:hypothetical protein